ncbi:MAG: Re/Si-specific NAD(P)(+) transhydrogenase subunit alpha [Planctomycetota bacterium]|nr:MAG: Re/Si-specific NAD(P)(+) transhydrogenase subunit alpha [Planctomycetota bacterium]
MLVGVPRETHPNERRVALTPGVLAALAKCGLSVVVEAGAGELAGFRDAEYAEKGAKLGSRAEALAADIVVQVRSAGANLKAGASDLAAFRPGQSVVGLCDPLGEPKGIADAAARGVNLFALEMVPRITRAQSMDVLSSMATVAGYRAVLIAAMTVPKMFPMMMTAAGTLAAAKVLILGAGVAGLQAIATARRLGAVVQAYDVRAAVKEQIQSLGAKFVELPLETGQAEDKGGYAKALGEEFYRKQRELLGDVVATSDVVIATAAIPGVRSPLLVTREAVERMPGGSVIVDLAAERGGNCELTKADETVVYGGVTILGPTNLPSEVPHDASLMFGKNAATLLAHIVKDGKVRLDADDEIIHETLAAKGGEVVHPRIREKLGLAPRG